MRKVLSLLVFLTVIFMGTGTASADLRWNKIGFDSESSIYVSPNYVQDQSLFALVGQDLYLSVDGGRTWDLTNTLPVWYVRAEHDKNLYIMQGADQDSLAIYKYNPGADGGWEKICSAPPSTALFTVLNNGTIIAVKPGGLRSYWHTLQAAKPGYTWQDTGYTRGGDFLESTPDGIVFTKEIGTEKVSKSITHGMTWKEIKPSYELGQFYIALNPYDNKIFTIVNKTSIHISYDRGESWQKRMTGMEKSGYLAGLAFSPDYKRDQTIYALDIQGRVYISKDGSASWKSYGVSVDSEDGYEFNTLAVLPGGRILAGASDGVYEVITYIPPAKLARSSFVIGKATYTIGQNDWLMDTAPYIDDGRTFVPVRYLAYAMGMNDNDILWDGTKNEATFTKNKTEVKITVGSRTLLVNKQPVAMDVQPQIRDGRVFLPARWVAEAFGATVSWDEQNRSVIIEYEK